MSALALRLEALRRPSQTVIAAGTVGIALFVLVLGWFVVVSPQRSRVSDLDAQIAQTQSQVTAARATSAVSAPTAAEAKRLSLAMPDVPDIPQVVDELSSTASAAGLTLVSIAPQSEEPAGAAYRVFPLTVVAQGRFFGVDAFLKRLRTGVVVHGASVEASGRLYDVSSVSLQQTEPAPSVLATLTVRVFAFAAGGAPAPATTTPATTPTPGG